MTFLLVIISVLMIFQGGILVASYFLPAKMIGLLFGGFSAPRYRKGLLPQSSEGIDPGVKL